MFNKTYAHTTIYNLPILPLTRNLCVSGDNLNTHVEVVTDFIFSFYKLLKNVIVLDLTYKFKDVSSSKHVHTIQNKKKAEGILKTLINAEIKQETHLIILNASAINNNFIMQLLAKKHKNLNVMLFYAKETAQLYDILFYMQQAIFFKTKQAGFLELAYKLCLENNFAVTVVLTKLKGFVNLDMQTRKCMFYTANIELKAHLLYNEVTEVLQVMFKNFNRKFF